jgi:hypothetical protein
LLGPDIDRPKDIEKKEEILAVAKKPFFDACILRMSEKLDPDHNLDLNLEVAVK